MRKTTIGATALLLVATTAGASQAQDALSQHLSPAFISCYQRASGNIVQTDVCASREVGAQDDRLNKAYQQVMRQLRSDPTAHDQLRSDERRWIAERDYSCKVNGNTVNAACVVIKTAARADALESRVRF